MGFQIVYNATNYQKSKIVNLKYTIKRLGITQDPLKKYRAIQKHMFFTILGLSLVDESAYTPVSNLIIQTLKHTNVINKDQRVPPEGPLIPLICLT